jgi:exosome complex RNA-binding protein Rrp4
MGNSLLKNLRINHIKEKKPMMSLVLIVSYILTIVISYNGAIYLSKKTGLL